MNNLPTFQELLERDAEKIKEIGKSLNKARLEPEWLILAEFGSYFGWQAVMDVRNDNITFQEMHKLLAASRRLESIRRYNNVMDTYAANIAIHDKGKALKQTLKGIKDSWHE